MSLIFFFAFALFMIGAIGVLFNGRDAVRLLLAFELMILASFMLISSASSFYHSATGSAFAFLMLAAAAVESALGLALLIAYHRLTGTQSINSLRRLKG